MPSPRAAKNTREPYPKTAAAGVAGAATVVLVYVAGLFGLEVPVEVGSALTALIAFGASYAKSA